jgi:hypothetical protein
MGFLEVPSISYFSVRRRTRRARVILKPVLETSQTLKATLYALIFGKNIIGAVAELLNLGIFR